MIHFSWGEIFLGPLAHLFSAGAGFFLIVLLIFFGRRALFRAKGALPERTLSLKSALELFISFIIGVSDSVIGPPGRKMAPLFGAVFLIIWIQNLFTLFPGFTAATDNLNSTLAFGLCSFALYNYYGIKHHGWGYIKHFLGPVLLIAPFMFILEMITHIMRPVSLALRLYGNMMGDHIVLSSFIDMAPLGIPVIFYFVGLFVCTIQAFVFTMLSMIYFSMAIAQDH